MGEAWRGAAPLQTTLSHLQVIIRSTGTGSGIATTNCFVMCSNSAWPSASMLFSPFQASADLLREGIQYALQMRVRCLSMGWRRYDGDHVRPYLCYTPDGLEDVVYRADRQIAGQERLPIRRVFPAPQIQRRVADIGIPKVDRAGIGLRRGIDEGVLRPRIGMQRDEAGCRRQCRERGFDHYLRRTI